MTTTQSPVPSIAPGTGDTPKVGMFSAEWCQGPQINLGGSDYWRLALPAAKLYEHGWDVKFARNLAETKNGRLVMQTNEGEWLDDRDIIVIQRWMGEGTAERILRARDQGQIIINEVDDNYWKFPDAHASNKTTDPEVNPNTNREHYRESIVASSLISVSTPYLAQELEDWGPPIAMIRNYIDINFWPLRPPGDYVGWVGGLPWRGNDLQLLRETVVPWMRERKQFFYHGGDVGFLGPKVPSIAEKLDYDRVSTLPLCQMFEYPKLWEPLRIALCPMEDSPFNRSKSWIKGLEASARGAPFICSDHVEYRELGVGRIVEKPEDWIRHLEELSDPDVYASDVATNRARAEELDIELHWERWADLFRATIKAGE